VDGKTPLPGAQVEVWQINSTSEVWQTNPTDFYDGSDYPPPIFNLGGQMHTDAAGRYEFTTLKPGPINVDQGYLPAQIHFKVSYQDHQPLFIRLFFAGDPYLNNIPAAPELTIRLKEQMGPGVPAWQGRFDVVMPVLPATP
jgi:protocatechuate 3,4-dioxygenase beta subunit